jgi:hypothetical protein
MTPYLEQRGRCEGSGKRNCVIAKGRFWWGEAPLWPHDVNEAADVLILKKLPGRKIRRAGVCSAAADKRTVGLVYVTISRVPAILGSAFGDVLVSGLCGVG